MFHINFSYKLFKMYVVQRKWILGITLKRKKKRNVEDADVIKFCNGLFTQWAQTWKLIITNNL